MFTESCKTIGFIDYRKIISRAALMMFLFSVCTACGAVGSPIPPEDVGIEAKLRKQRQQQTKEDLTTEGESTEEIPLEEEPVTLPPLHPIGTR